MNLIEKINPSHTALLVIDVQNDFASPDGMLARQGRDLSMVGPMITKLLPTIVAAEKAGVPVLYAQQIYDRSKLNDLQKEQYDFDGKLITCDIATEGYKFYKINPAIENVFIKYDYNPFSNLNLVKFLEEKGIKTIVMAGMDTCYCVETAIRNAFDKGYKVVVGEDIVACGGKNRDFHERTLELVRKTFGTVASADEIIAIWNK